MIRKLTQLAAAGYAALTLSTGTPIIHAQTQNQPIIATVKDKYGCLANVNNLTTNCDQLGLTLEYNNRTCDVAVFPFRRNEANSLLPFAKQVEIGKQVEIKRIFGCQKYVRGYVYLYDINILGPAEDPKNN